MGKALTVMSVCKDEIKISKSRKLVLHDASIEVSFELVSLDLDYIPVQSEELLW